jgi:putative choline sulfate-utilization transcription factor
MSRNPLDTGCLRLFDAAARHRNLSHAAAALGMTQPALSYRIRQMEDLLNVRLFRRRHRGLELTGEGETLQVAVRQGLERLDEAVEVIRRRVRTPSVRLATDFAFAAFRLMPQVASFRRANPGLDVQIVAGQSLAPGMAADADLAVLFGDRDDFSEGFADAPRLLMPERVTPVCTPGFRARFGPFEHIEQLLAVPLVHLEDDGGDRWFTWQSWFAQAGVPYRPTVSSLSFNTYTLAIQAVLAEQGVALGWTGLVDDLLSSRALVPAFDATLGSRRGYWLLRPDGVLSPQAERVASWLAGVSEETVS